MHDDLFERYLEPMAPIPTPVIASGNLKQAVHAVLFDVYGTLFVSGSGDVGRVESANPADTALDDVIRSYGLSVSPDSLTRNFWGKIRAEHVRLQAGGIAYPEIRVERIWSELLGLTDKESVRRFALAFELIMNPAWPMPGMKRLIEGCKSAGLKMGVVSNAQFYTPLLFEFFCGGLPEDLGFDADLLFYSYRTGHAKPSSVLFEVVKTALYRKEIAPGNTLFVGNDMRNDIAPAAAAGMQTALFAGDERSLRLRRDDPCCNDLEPDLYITDLRQLPAHIRKAFRKAPGGKSDPD